VPLKKSHQFLNFMRGPPAQIGSENMMVNIVKYLILIN